VAAAGADLSKIAHVKNVFDMGEIVDKTTKILKDKEDIKLLILDPLTEFLGNAEELTSRNADQVVFQDRISETGIARLHQYIRCRDNSLDIDPSCSLWIEDGHDPVKQSLI